LHIKLHASDLKENSKEPSVITIYQTMFILLTGCPLVMESHGI